MGEAYNFLQIDCTGPAVGGMMEEAIATYDGNILPAAVVDISRFAARARANRCKINCRDTGSRNGTMGQLRQFLAGCLKSYGTICSRKIRAQMNPDVRRFDQWTVVREEEVQSQVSQFVSRARDEPHVSLRLMFREGAYHFEPTCDSPSAFRYTLPPAASRGDDYERGQG